MLTIRRVAAFAVLVGGGCLVVAGFVGWGVVGGLTVAGLLLIAAGVSSL